MFTLSKLTNFSIHPSLNFITLILIDPFQYVRFHCKISTPYLACSGVPQESKLGSLIFLFVSTISPLLLVFIYFSLHSLLMIWIISMRFFHWGLSSSSGRSRANCIRTRSNRFTINILKSRTVFLSSKNDSKLLLQSWLYSALKGHGTEI